MRSIDSPGQDDVGSYGIAHNGGLNYDFPAATMPRSQWVAVQLRLKLNTPGLRDGREQLWLNDVLISNVSNLGGTDMRPSTSDAEPFRSVGLGGWYSNGGTAPNVPAVYYYDDVTVDTEYAPMLSSSTVVVRQGYCQRKGNFMAGALVEINGAVSRSGFGTCAGGQNSVHGDR